MDRVYEPFCIDVTPLKYKTAMIGPITPENNAPSAAPKKARRKTSDTAGIAKIDRLPPILSRLNKESSAAFCSRPMTAWASVSRNSNPATKSFTISAIEISFKS